MRRPEAYPLLNAEFGSPGMPAPSAGTIIAAAKQGDG